MKQRGMLQHMRFMKLQEMLVFFLPVLEVKNVVQQLFFFSLPNFFFNPPSMTKNYVMVFGR